MVSKPQVFKTHFKKKRQLQVYYALLFWLQAKKTRSVKVLYTSSKASGRICYHASLMRFIKNWTGLKHCQVRRYLNDMQKRGFFYKDDNQLWLDGKKRCQYFLHPNAPLMPKEGEKKLKIQLSGAGRKGFDIHGHIEKTYNADLHPKDKNQLSFNVSRQTRWARKQAKNYQKKPQKSPKTAQKRHQKPRRLIFHTVKNMNPKKNQTRFPFLSECKTKTVFCQKQRENYHGQFRLKSGHRDFWVDWWKVKREDAPAGQGAPIEKVIWYKKRLYQQSSTDPYLFIYRPRFKPEVNKEKKQLFC